MIYVEYNVIKNWRIGVWLLVIGNWLYVLTDNQFPITNNQFSKNGANVRQYLFLLYKILKVVYQKDVINKEYVIYFEKNQNVSSEKW